MRILKAIHARADIKRCLLSLLLLVGVSNVTFAAQFDAPFYELQKKHASQWAKEDQSIDAKLAEL